MRNKNRQVNFRVTESEYAQLHKKSELAKMNLSNYLLHSGLEKNIVFIKGLPEFVRELHKIGVNLNQLTKLANEGKLHSPDLKELMVEVHQIWQSLNSLTRKVV